MTKYTTILKSPRCKLKNELILSESGQTFNSGDNMRSFHYGCNKWSLTIQRITSCSAIFNIKLEMVYLNSQTIFLITYCSSVSHCWNITFKAFCKSYISKSFALFVSEESVLILPASKRSWKQFLFKLLCTYISSQLKCMRLWKHQQGRS